MFFTQVHTHTHLVKRNLWQQPGKRLDQILKRNLRTNVSARCTICRPKISPPKVIYKVQSMPYESLPLGAFWTIFGRNFPTGVPELLYPYQPANPLVESTFKALKC